MQLPIAETNNLVGSKLKTVLTTAKPIGFLYGIKHNSNLKSKYIWPISYLACRGNKKLIILKPI